MSDFANHPRDPVIVASCRTAVGRIRGALSSVRPDDLLAHVFSNVVERAQIDKEQIDEVIAGCANQAGEDNRNVARMSALLAQFPQHIPGFTVNRLCASGLEAVVLASRAIRVGDMDLCIAGGVESMSRAPYSMGKPDTAYPIGTPSIFDTSLGWRYPNPRLEALFPLEQMGETAENLVDEFKITRERQDQFAYESHQKALAAQTGGYFDHEIVPYAISQRKKPTWNFEKDEGPRADTTPEKLAKLRPAFRKEGGSVTAGNSSTLNDGAAAIAICAREYAEANGHQIMGAVRGACSAGVNPRTMGIGPVPATEKLLGRTGISIKDLDAIELNEAFAAQALAVIEKLGCDESKVNIHGGAIALGHPLGCSGARILTTLMSVLQRTDGRLGLATLCVGVGQGVSLLIERES
jgi:acetyl-CoA acyltransferase